jgi:hypothetical protein
MKPELDEKLVKEFPNLYRDRYGDKMETCMVYGFPSDGWFDIIYNLSAKLEKLIMEIPEDERAYYKASQVKEKFGGLRFYMTASTPDMEKLIEEAEELSLKTCETCGKSGSLRSFGGWLVTLCDEHANSRK